MREKVEVLEDQTEIVFHLSQLGAAHIFRMTGLVCGNGRLIHVADLAGVDLFQEGGAAKQGRLARTGGADDGDDLALIHVEADILEDFQSAEGFLNGIHL